MVDLEQFVEEMEFEISKLSSCLARLKKQLAKTGEESATNKGASEVEPFVLNIEEVAERLGVTRQTIYTWTRKRIIPYYKVGKKICFNKDDIMEYLKNYRAKSINEIEAESREYVATHPKPSPKTRKGSKNKWDW